MQNPLCLLCLVLYRFCMFSMIFYHVLFYLRGQQHLQCRLFGLSTLAGLHKHTHAISQPSAGPIIEQYLVRFEIWLATVNKKRVNWHIWRIKKKIFGSVFVYQNIWCFCIKRFLSVNLNLSFLGRSVLAKQQNTCVVFIVCACVLDHPGKSKHSESRQSSRQDPF